MLGQIERWVENRSEKGIQQSFGFIVVHGPDHRLEKFYVQYFHLLFDTTPEAGQWVAFEPVNGKNQKKHQYLLATKVRLAEPPAAAPENVINHPDIRLERKGEMVDKAYVQGCKTCQQTRSQCHCESRVDSELLVYDSFIGLIGPTYRRFFKSRPTTATAEGGEAVAK